MNGQNKSSSNPNNSGLRVKMNPGLAQDLTNAQYVVDDKVNKVIIVLDSETIGTILISLLNEFGEIYKPNLKHNVELSQYYLIEHFINDKKCENCEIVLKYNDTNICLSQTETLSVTEQKIKCNVDRGTVDFFVKQKNGDCYTYSRIRIIQIEMANTLENTKKMYYNNDEINRIVEAGKKALAGGQTDVINRSPIIDNLNKITNKIDGYFGQAKNALFNTYPDQITSVRAFSNKPTQQVIDAAKKAASAAKNKYKNIKLTLAPGNNVPVFEKQSFNTIVDRTGIQMKGGFVDINRNPIIPIDAKLVVTPRTDVNATNRNTDIGVLSQTRTDIRTDANGNRTEIKSVAAKTGIPSRNDTETRIDVASRNPSRNGTETKIGVASRNPTETKVIASRNVTENGNGTERGVITVGKNGTEFLNISNRPSRNITENKSIGENLKKAVESVGNYVKKVGEDTGKVFENVVTEVKGAI